VGAKRITGVALAFAVTLSVVACRADSLPEASSSAGGSAAGTQSTAGLPTLGVSPGDTPGPDGSAGLPSALGPVWSGPHYDVGVRTIELSRGPDRPLTTLIFYPTASGPAESNPAASNPAASNPTALNPTPLNPTALHPATSSPAASNSAEPGPDPAPPAAPGPDSTAGPGPFDPRPPATLSAPASAADHFTNAFGISTAAHLNWNRPGITALRPSRITRATGVSALAGITFPQAFRNRQALTDRDHARLVRRRARHNRRARIRFFAGTTGFSPSAGLRGKTPADSVLMIPDGPEPAPGRFPLVFFSHGLRGSPVLYSAALVSWAAAGFVVAAPLYPHTSNESAPFVRADIVNQPADALFVMEQVRALDSTAGDPLAGHIDVDRVAAVGHSAGGYTTTGLFVAGHPEWLRAGVVIAGWLAPGAFDGPPATMLYLQGARDNVVPVTLGRAAFDATPWWKSYVLLPDSWHADYMVPSGRNYPIMDETVTDFLRWTLDGDEAAHLRLPPSSFPTGHAE
jgi:dienelactone hydrolase